MLFDRGAPGDHDEARRRLTAALAVRRLQMLHAGFTRAYFPPAGVGAA
jgi:hypothetical protein